MSSEGMQSPESNIPDDIEMQRLAANFTVRVKNDTHLRVKGQFRSHFGNVNINLGSGKVCVDGEEREMRNNKLIWRGLRWSTW